MTRVQNPLLVITVLSQAGEGLRGDELSLAENLLEHCCQLFRPDRGLILTQTPGGWSAAALHNLPQQDFWAPENLSLAGIDACATSRTSQVMMDAPVADEQRLAALMSGNLYSFMACPTADGDAVVYLARELSSGVYKEEELHRLEEFLKTCE